MTFKVGDRVRVIGNTEYCSLYHGAVYTVVRLFSKLAFPVMVGFLGGTATFRANELELVNEEIQNE